MSTSEGERAYRNVKEHIDLLVQILESAGIIRKLVVAIGGRCVPQEDTLHLVGKVDRQLGIGLHHVAVARVGHQHELPLRIGGENLSQEEITDPQGCADIAEIEGSRVERTTRVGLVDELHVIPRHLFGGGGEVVEMDVRHAARPVGVDAGHVHPRGKRAGERIQQTFLGLVDLGHAKDIINIRNDGDAGLWHEIGRCISDVASLGIDVQSLDLIGGIASLQSGAFDLHECIKIALLGRGIGKLDLLTATGRGLGSSSTGLT